MIPLIWKLRLPPGHFGFLMTECQQVNKGVSKLARVTSSYFKGKVRLLLQYGSKKDVRNAEGVYSKLPQYLSYNMPKDSLTQPGKECTSPKDGLRHLASSLGGQIILLSALPGMVLSC